MCRFLAYRGDPVFMEDLVCSPRHSLIHQSLHAEEAKVATNGDGFGLGWYGERREPGVYRELRPAWSDENLLSLCRLVRAHVFFAHVRAATGTATMRANCHPFTFERWMFMHNGQIGGYGLIRRRLEALLPDALYASRAGTTDSELVFLLIVGRIEAGESPVEATAGVLRTVKELMSEANVSEPLRFNAAITDGETVFAFRAACDDRPPSLYVCERPEAAIIASEPLDQDRSCWREIPKGVAVVMGRGGMRIEPDFWSRVARH
ncbi:MAG: class II glutamine amidotransferase [Rhizobiales bacterium 65-9]|mgnify:CR=1 FL=1|nr:class II glutamine amidotransferase [Hyphomicrobiales bacterium]OJY36097.1 MAG: class II glutamine amidotransferase [Rhizobiales bacterium 65-9]